MKHYGLIVGFTGTKKGMSPNQKTMLGWLCEQLTINSLHHGFCIGADKEAEHIIFKHQPDVRIQRHPAGDRPLARDKEIVAAVEILIAAPRQDKEVLRSGTWATVRYARAKGIPIIMLPRR